MKPTCSSWPATLGWSSCWTSATTVPVRRSLTTRVAGPTLTECSTALPVRAAAGAVAALAQTVADLHDLGVVHGRIGADRVIIGADGRPVLCGFASARGRGLTAPSDTSEPSPLSPQGDVADLGALLRSLVGQVEGSPIPDQRRRAWSRARSDDDDRRTLLTLADHATHDDPEGRPSASQLSAAVLAAVPDACLPSARTGIEVEEPIPEPIAAGVGFRRGSDASPTDASRTDNRGVAGCGINDAETDRGGIDQADNDDVDTDDGAGTRPRAVPRPLPVPPRRRVLGLSCGPGRRRRPRLIWAAGVAVAAAIVGLGMAAAPAVRSRAASHEVVAQGQPARPSPSPSPPSVSRPSSPAHVPTSTVDAPVTAAPPPRSLPSDCHAPPAPAWSETAADVDGDGCLDPVRVGDGAVRTIAHRYVVGSAGDPVVVGDWDCNGTATPATVRRATGELFVFEEWAEPNRDVSVPVRATVPADATITSSDPDGHGCPVVELHQPGQPARIIDDRPLGSGGGK